MKYIPTAPKEYVYDFVVVGGGLTGICAAIAAARHGKLWRPRCPYL